VISLLAIHIYDYYVLYALSMQIISDITCYYYFAISIIKYLTFLTTMLTFFFMTNKGGFRNI